MAGLFARHEGRQVNTWGDAVIAEFSSVVEAVRCAVEIQDSISAENRSLPKPTQMWFRIGINLGDVMVDKDNLYGDGVNVAQRLESLAEPGGIMVSGTVHSLAHKQLALAFDFAGEQEIKNSEDRVASLPRAHGRPQRSRSDRGRCGPGRTTTTGGAFCRSRHGISTACGLGSSASRSAFASASG